MRRNDTTRLSHRENEADALGFRVGVAKIRSSLVHGSPGMAFSVYGHRVVLEKPNRQGSSGQRVYVRPIGLLLWSPHRLSLSAPAPEARRNQGQFHRQRSVQMPKVRKG